jgi:hypothetical protein
MRKSESQSADESGETIGISFPVIETQNWDDLNGA